VVTQTAHLRQKVLIVSDGPTISIKKNKVVLSKLKGGLRTGSRGSCEESPNCSKA